MTFFKVYNEWKIYASKQHKKQCFDTYITNFKNHVLPYFESYDIIDVNLKSILSWKNNILSKNYSNNFNKNIYICFNSFLDFCVLNNYIDKNYLRLTGSFKKKYEDTNYELYNYLEFKHFEKGLTNIVYRYFYDFLFFYGVRSGEAMALQFSDIEGFYIHIGKNMSRRGKREIDTPKTRNSNRYLKIKPIMRFKFFILQCYYLKKYGCMSDYFVFGGLKPLSPTSIIRYKHNACLTQNMKEIKIHEFRHSYATRMISLGVPVHVVSKRLGHSSISITLDTYVHNKKIRPKSYLRSNFFLDPIFTNCKKITQYIITRFIV